MSGRCPTHWTTNTSAHGPQLACAEATSHQQGTPHATAASTCHAPACSLPRTLLPTGGRVRHPHTRPPAQHPR
eukprot:5582527-Prymnesium_polylepis.2